MSARVKITDEMVEAAISEIRTHAMRDGVHFPNEREAPDEWEKMRAAFRDALSAAAAVAREGGRDDR